MCKLSPRLTMLSVLLLCCAVLTLRTTATRYHLQRTSLPSGPDEVDPETHPRLETKTYFIRNKDNKRAQKPVHRGSEDDYWKGQHKSCFSALIMKSQAFLCLDSKGKLYTSVFDSNEDCQFRRVKRHKHYDTFHSCRGDVLLVNHRQVKIDTHNLPKLSDFVSLKRHKTRTRPRKRRSWHTDPSDPLGVSDHAHLSSMRNWRNGPEHGGHVSKETITSVDDPLEVLLSHSARTPTLEKHSANRKMRF